MRSGRVVVLLVFGCAAIVAAIWMVGRSRSRLEAEERCDAARSAERALIMSVREGRYSEAASSLPEYLRLREALGPEPGSCVARRSPTSGPLGWFTVARAQLEILSGGATFADIDQLYESLGTGNQQYDWTLCSDRLEVAVLEGIPTEVVLRQDPRDPPVDPERSQSVVGEVLLAANAALAPKGLVWGELAAERQSRNVHPLRIEITIRWKHYLAGAQGASVAEAMTLRMSRQGYGSSTVEVDRDLPGTYSFAKSGRQWDSAQTMARVAAEKLKARSLRDFM
jgi:hypothetical protein